MMTVRCYLAPSQIEGLGVYSHEDIKKGQEVWRYDPILDISIPSSKLGEVATHIAEFLDRYTYPDPHRPDCIMLDGDEGRFMNHSDTPNLDFTSADYGVALTDIPAGTELTCNYGDLIKGEIVMQPPRHAVGSQRLNGAAA